MINEFYKQTCIEPRHGNILTYNAKMKELLDRTKEATNLNLLEIVRDRLKDSQDEEVFDGNKVKALKHIEIAIAELNKVNNK